MLSGYSTSPASSRAFRKVRRRLDDISYRRSCPYIAFSDRHNQQLNNALVRAAADIVVIPSQSEAYGLVAAESLAYGAIPVVSAVGGLPEIITAFDALSRETSRWTGFEFPFFVEDMQLTSAALRLTIHNAMTQLQSLQRMHRSDSLCKRLILSTPRASEGIESYSQLVTGLLDQPLP